MSTESDTAGRKPDCVVLDTNIWRSDLLLKTPMGVSLIYTLGRQGGFIGLPEVVEGELKEQVVEEGLKAAEQLAKSSRIINTLTDSSFSPSLPTQIALEKIVDARLAELAPILVRVPFMLEHAKYSNGSTHLVGMVKYAEHWEMGTLPIPTVCPSTLTVCLYAISPPTAFPEACAPGHP